jgi:hypothetical protein
VGGRRARRTAPQPGCRHQRPLQSTPARDVPSSSRGHGLLWPGSTQPAGAQKCPRSWRRQIRLAPSLGNASQRLWKQGGGGGPACILCPCTRRWGMYQMAAAAQAQQGTRGSHVPIEFYYEKYACFARFLLCRSSRYRSIYATVVPTARSIRVYDSTVAFVLDRVR